MNKGKARKFAYELTIASLRRKAEVVRTGDLDPRATQKDVAKVQEQMRKLASDLEQKLNKRRRASEPEARAPGPDEGKDNLPEDPHAPDEGVEAAAAG